MAIFKEEDIKLLKKEPITIAVSNQLFSLIFIAKQFLTYINFDL